MLAEALAYLRADNTLVVCKLDRLGLSMSHLLEKVSEAADQRSNARQRRYARNIHLQPLRFGYIIPVLYRVGQRFQASIFADGHSINIYGCATSQGNLSTLVRPSGCQS